MSVTLSSHQYTSPVFYAMLLYNLSDYISLQLALRNC
uniref:Uncharacterized protein n=1 Tax=Rhizophora mucronata TaxID=61149 RepID=A0A2P2NLY9_RHIMU